MRENSETFACPHCAADNRVGELHCCRCGRRLPRSSAELREAMIRRLEAERQARTRRHLAISVVVGAVVAAAIRVLADVVPQDIVGMSTLVELARLFWWLAGILWGGIAWLALRSGST